MSETNVPTPGGQPPEPLIEEAKSKKDFEERQRQLAADQNLPAGSVPEQRPIASQTVDDEALHSKVFRDLREAGDNRADDKAMEKAAYDRAHSKTQMQKSARESRVVTNLPVGTRGYIDNPGQPDHGRAVHIRRVASYKDLNNQLLAAAGTPESRFAEAAEYECESRDGRAELLIVSVEHFNAQARSEDWGKTPIH